MTSTGDVELLIDFKFCHDFDLTSTQKLQKAGRIAADHWSLSGLIVFTKDLRQLQMIRETGHQHGIAH